MEERKEQAEDLTSTKEKHTLFKSNDILEIKRLFEEADTDGSGGLDMEEFYEVMSTMYPHIDKEEVKILHMQVDANCDGTVDLAELLTFLLNKSKAAEEAHRTSESFPRPIKIVPGNVRYPIVGMEFCPHENVRKTHTDSLDENQRRYINGDYISINSCGIITRWSDNFEKLEKFPLYPPEETLPYSHPKKVDVKQVVYIKELRQLAVRSVNREILFFNFTEALLIKPDYALIMDTNRPVTMKYWSDGTKGVFSLGDVDGFSYVSTSFDVKKNKLFPFDAYERISLLPFPSVKVSSLLKRSSETHQCLQFQAITEPVSNVEYLPSIHALLTCARSSKTMALAFLPQPPHTKVSRYVFKSTKDNEFFTCADYVPSAGVLVSGGTDGVLRVWNPTVTKVCEAELRGHDTPVTHVMSNHNDKIVVSVSEDKNIRVWSEKGWQCNQSFFVDEMGKSPILNIHYNKWNNDLILVNTNIGKMFGRGTDAFIKSMTSHDRPMCRALYHHLFKQVVSVSQNGVVKVWDIFTGQIIIKFKVSQGKCVGHIAMSFDEAQRRLITVAMDRKVRLWNFNNGTEINALPVYVPKEVTSIVCKDDRIFVAGRNCKTIFDLDINGLNNRFLKHPYLTDITSMDVYENSLVAASSDGNVVTWDIERNKPLYWLNIRISPKTELLVEGQASSMPVVDNEKNCVTETGRTATPPKKKAAVNQLVLCLKKRGMDSNIATVLTCTGHYIYAWSFGHCGGLLGKFRAVDDDGAVITTMSTDANEEILLTGDSTGKVCLWDIRHFGYKQPAADGPSEDIKGWEVSLLPPLLLSKWQSHLTAVVSVTCDPVSNNVITASLDCNMGLWTNTGHCIGIFRKDEWDAKARNSSMPESKKLLCEIPNQTGKKSGKSLSHAVKNVMTGLNLMKPQAKEESKQTSDHVKLPPITNTAQVTQMQLKPNLPQTSHISDGTGLERSSPETASPNLNQTRRRFTQVTRNLPNDTLTPHPPNTLPDQRACGQISNHEKLPPIPNTGQVMHGQSEFKQHVPQNSNVRGGTDLERSSPETASPNLNQTRRRFARVVRHLPVDILTPHPPNPLPGQQASEQMSHSAKLPPIPNAGQLMHGQSEFKQHVPLTSNIRGGTGLERSSPQTASPNLNQTRHGQGALFRHHTSDILTPHPPNTVPGQQASEQMSHHAKLPPIPNTGQLMHGQSEFKQHVSQTSNIRKGTGLERSSPQTVPTNLNQTRHKYGRVIRHHTSDILTPHPPNQLPGQQASEQMSHSAKLPPIPNTGQLMHKQHVPQTSNIRGDTGLERGSPQTTSPNLNQTRYKYGQAVRPHTSDFLTPHPPNTRQASRPLSKHQAI